MKIRIGVGAAGASATPKALAELRGPNRIEDWVTDEGEAEEARQVERIEALQTCLDSLLYVVSIKP